MKILFWNINGIRAILKKNVNDQQSFEKYLISTRSDIICFNETKITGAIMDKITILESYPYVYHAYSETKKGYSGVSIYSKIKPLKQYTFSENEEGRVLGLEFESFILINVYQPNAGSKLQRLQYRCSVWKSKFKSYIQRLQKIKPVIIAGDMNVAFTEMDVANASKHETSAGYTIEERSAFEDLLVNCKLIDSWRYLNPSKIQYTYFDYRSKARDHNRGWRIDYFLVSKRIIKKISKVTIQSNIYGSDHLPIICNLDD